MSGKIAQRFFSAYSGRFAISVIAQVTAPEEIPAKIPSFFARKFVIL